VASKKFSWDLWCTYLIFFFNKQTIFYVQFFFYPTLNWLNFYIYRKLIIRTLKKIWYLGWKFIGSLVFREWSNEWFRWKVEVLYLLELQLMRCLFGLHECNTFSLEFFFFYSLNIMWSCLIIVVSFNLLPKSLDNYIKLQIFLLSKLFFMYFLQNIT